MIPYIIYIQDNEGKITLTKQELEKIIKDAFAAGYDHQINKVIPKHNGFYIDDSITLPYHPNSSTAIPSITLLNNSQGISNIRRT